MTEHDPRPLCFWCEKPPDEHTETERVEHGHSYDRLRELGQRGFDGLLSPQEKADMDAALRKMANDRRRAEAESRNIVLP